MTTTTEDTTGAPRYENSGAIDVYLAAQRALILAGTDPETARETAHDVATRVEDAYENRDDPELHALRSGELDRLNRAELTHTFRCRFSWDGRETHRAAFVLEQIEAELGVRFPEPTERQRFFATSLSVWDKLTDRWACYGPDGCGTWAPGDGVKGLAPHWCHCGNRVVL